MGPQPGNYYESCSIKNKYIIIDSIDEDRIYYHKVVDDIIGHAYIGHSFELSIQLLTGYKKKKNEIEVMKLKLKGIF